MSSKNKKLGSPQPYNLILKPSANCQLSNNLRLTSECVYRIDDESIIIADKNSIKSQQCSDWLYDAKPYRIILIMQFYNRNNYKKTRQDLKQPYNLQETIHEGRARGMNVIFYKLQYNECISNEIEIFHFIRIFELCLFNITGYKWQLPATGQNKKLILKVHKSNQNNEELCCFMFAYEIYNNDKIRSKSKLFYFKSTRRPKKCMNN
ncbi:hypothetical protein AGLY_002818 [Aphis glycines]|uniref:Uncharacterized protein n=1 Tax=Aphis glycines TaxID=307491 RepID=A0A6G0U1R4_APHGL|nr:hypothetical protein AGLY_002818 [Aphis glycines]